MDMFRFPHAKSSVILAFLCAIAPQAAFAGASAWEEGDGARLRIVTEAWQPGMTTLRGALQIDLEPGWKTYWREPGSAGIPPQVTLSGGAADAVTIHFPVPLWVDDAYGSWAGYKQPVNLPLTFTLASADGDPAIGADVFLGVCSDVCVPVSAHLDVPLASTSASSLQTIVVDAAFADLPDGNSDALSIGAPTWTADGMVQIPVTHAAGDGEAELFLSAGVERPFRKPVIVSDDGHTTVFAAEPLSDAAKAGGFDLLVAARRGEDTAETTIQLPGA